MQSRTGVFVLVVVHLWSPLSIAADSDELVKKFSGSWKVLRAEKQGILLSDERLKTMRVTIEGGKISIRDGADEDVATLKFDPAIPGAIDFLPIDDAKVPAPGIYAFDGDTLKICWAGVGRTRPTEFRSKAETDTRLFVLGRDK